MISRAGLPVAYQERHSESSEEQAGKTNGDPKQPTVLAHTALERIFATAFTLAGAALCAANLTMADHFFWPRLLRDHALNARPAAPKAPSARVLGSGVGTRKPRISPPGKAEVWMFQ